jgi:hypothetical protein
MSKMYQMAENYNNWTHIVSNGHKIGTLYGHKTNQHFPIQGPPKFTQIGIFGLKINHLATLPRVLP